MVLPGQAKSVQLGFQIDGRAARRGKVAEVRPPWNHGLPPNPPWGTAYFECEPSASIVGRIIFKRREWSSSVVQYFAAFQMCTTMCAINRDNDEIDTAGTSVQQEQVCMKKSFGLVVWLFVLK